MADLTDLVPVSRQEFATELVPCLALTGGAGMNVEARREWLNAAYKALEGIPILLLQRGSRAAMAKADHPSKIVPTILEAIKADWDWRKNYYPPRSRPVKVWEPAPRISPEERQEVSAMFDQLLSKLGSSEDKPA